LKSAEKLVSATEGCRYILEDLQTLLSRYEGLSADGEAMSGRTRKLWHKIRFGSKIQGLRDTRAKIITYTSTISVLLDAMQLKATGRLEDKVDAGFANMEDNFINMKKAIVDEVLKARSRTRGESTVSLLSLSTHNEDDKKVWQEFRRELIAKGFDSTKLDRHKDVLKAYILKFEQCGVLNELKLPANENTPWWAKHALLATKDTLATASDGTIWTTYEGDDEDFWRELRRELVDEGCPSSVLYKHRDAIKDYILELVSCGKFNANGVEAGLDAAQGFHSTVLRNLTAEEGESAVSELAPLEATTSDPMTLALATLGSTSSLDTEGIPAHNTLQSRHQGRLNHISYVLRSSDSEDEYEDESGEASGDESLSSGVRDNAKGQGACGPCPQMLHGYLGRNLCIVSSSEDENKHGNVFMEKKPLLEKHEAYNPCQESQQERSRRLFYGVTSSEDENESEDEIENKAKGKGVHDCESATTEKQRAHNTLQVRREAHLELAFCTGSTGEDGVDEDAEKAVEALPENDTDEDSPDSRIGVEAHKESDDAEREYEDTTSTEAPSVVPSEPRGTEMMSTHNQEQSVRSLSSGESECCLDLVEWELQNLGNSRSSSKTTLVLHIPELPS
jgi:hypothetical protein